MSAKTVKRLAILVTTVLVAGLSLFFIQRYQVEKMDRSVRAQAEQAEKDGNYDEAKRLYEEHLEIAPDDPEAKLKYAEVLLKGPKTLARLEQAAQLYDQHVARSSADKMARRRLVELNVELGPYDKARYVKARDDLALLLNSEPEDGSLSFLLGCCQEALDDFTGAEKSFANAIKYHAPQRPEADSRLAMLRGRLNKTKEADQVIKKMVEDQPDNYQVYLERGRYHRLFGRTAADREGARRDFELAREKNPNDPRVYTELAELARSSGKHDEARRALEAGLTALPNEPALHLEQAKVELTGSIDKAIMSLRRSLELLPDDLLLRWNLAQLLAQRGATSELLEQIGELKRLNFHPIQISLLEARYLTNSNDSSDWKKAIQSLIRLQPLVEQSEQLKAQVNDLLAQCYRRLGERDRELEAYGRSIRANPRDIQARMGLAASLADGGEIDQAISEYEQLLKQLPPDQQNAEFLAICGRLVPLLIARNQQRSVEQRNWTEVEKLISEVKESAPQSSGWVILQTDLLVAQDKIAQAQDLLEQARSQTPRNVDLWLKSAELGRRQRRLDDARKLLDQAQKSFGDSVALRLERSQLLLAQGGAQLPRDLAALAENSESFSHSDRRRLLQVLAQEAAGLNDRTLVKDLWSRVARLDPNDLEPQLRLLDLAFQAKDRAEIEKQIDEVKRIDGAEGSNAKFEEARHTIWQAENTTDRAEQARLRDTARVQLNDLAARRPDWAKLPRILGDLALADSVQPGLSEAQKKSKQRAAFDQYNKAIKLGQRDLDTIRRAAALYYATEAKGKAEDKGGAIELWTQLSVPAAARGAGLQQGAIEALLHGDNEAALELARRAEQADPNGLQGSYFLAQMLTSTGHPDQAKTELRKAVDAAPRDPDRWIALVKFLITSQALDEAEGAVREAENALKEKPLGPAECCEALGQAYKTSGQNEQKSSSWLARAGRWYTAAGKAGRLAVNRPYLGFLYRSGQIKEVQSQLRAILADKRQGEDPKNAEEIAWARRTLASILLASRDAEQRQEALTLVAAMAQTTPQQQKEDGQPPRPEDLRLLAAVYEAQETPAYHKKARDVLEQMDRWNVADPDDRLKLASMYSRDGDWGHAHDQYRKLLAQTENTSDLEVSKRRPDYIARFIDELLKRVQGDQRQELLTEAQDLLEQFKALRPDAFQAIVLEARLDKAQNQMGKAIELIQATASRPNLSDPVWQLLANLADQLGEGQLAEDLLRQLVKKSDRPQNRMALAIFLSRHGRIEQAFDLCEQVWNVTPSPEDLVQATLEVLSYLEGDREKAQAERVAGWMQKGLEKQPKSTLLVIALAGIRERQGRYQEAEDLYTRGIQQERSNAIVPKNLATMLNNLAWLMALRNDDETLALRYINRAIELSEPNPAPELLDTRGVVYMKLRRSQDAINDLIAAAQLDPSGPKYFHLAQAYLQAGDKPAAAESLDKARSKGLTPNRLHALELNAYQQVVDELGKR